MYICISTHKIASSSPTSNFTPFLFFRTPCGQEEGASDRAVKRRSACGRVYSLVNQHSNSKWPIYSGFTH